MTKLQETVVSFFEDNGWQIVELELENSWKVPFSGVHGDWDCFARVREQQQQFVFYSIFPRPVAPARRTEVALLITKLNYGLVIGNFELDLTDGEIRYKTSIDITNDRLTHELIKPMVFTNVATMDKNFPELMAAVTGSDVAPNVTSSNAS